MAFGKGGEPYWKESIWIFIGYLILVAEELGYGTQAIVPVGKAAETPSPPGRMPLEAVGLLRGVGTRVSERILTYRKAALQELSWANPKRMCRLRALG